MADNERTTYVARIGGGGSGGACKLLMCHRLYAFACPDAVGRHLGRA